MSAQIVSAFVIACVLLAAFDSTYAAVTPPLCEPGVLEEMPSHIKKVCIALENSNQLSSALTAYIKNEAAALNFKPEELLQPNFKRTDVDHVFLRFGRRR